MAEQFRFFGSAVGDTRQYNQPQFAEVLKTFIGNGYMADIDNELAVIASTPNAMSVEVGTGQGWINGYWYKNDASKSITIATADATHPRIDLIVLRLDTINARSIVATVITGTPSSVPVVPTLTETEQLWEIPLAQVYVGAAVTTIVSGNITDQRYQALMQDTDEILAQVALKAPLASPTFTGTVSGITATMVGLGNVDNTSDANKPISTATQTALDGKLSLTGGTLTGALNGTAITTTGEIKTDTIKLTGDRIENHSINGEAHVAINAYGYNGGATQFRNLTIYDGKANVSAQFKGSDKSTTLYGDLFLVKSGTSRKIIEVGSNANGKYIKFADGDLLMVCRNTEFGTVDGSPATKVITFPYASVTIVNYTLGGYSYVSPGIPAIFTADSDAATTSITVGGYFPSGRTNYQGVMAIIWGRWY